MEKISEVWTVGGDSSASHVADSSGAGAIRYIEANDAHRLARWNWLNVAFDDIQIFHFSSDQTHGLSEVNGMYGALVVGMNDVVRAAAFMKKNLPILGEHPKIALVSMMSPAKRAALLDAGFDDVWDVSKLDRLEAVARLESFGRRYDMARSEVARHRDVLSRISEVAHVERLTRREADLLDLLLRAKHGKCSTAMLRAELGENGHEITLGNLKVIISNIRKKMKNGFVIESDRSGGYEILAGCDV